MRWRYRPEYVLLMDNRKAQDSCSGSEHDVAVATRQACRERVGAANILESDASRSRENKPASSTNHSNAIVGYQRYRSDRRRNCAIRRGVQAAVSTYTSRSCSRCQACPLKSCAPTVELRVPLFLVYAWHAALCAVYQGGVSGSCD